MSTKPNSLPFVKKLPNLVSIWLTTTTLIPFQTTIYSRSYSTTVSRDISIPLLITDTYKDNTKICARSSFERMSPATAYKIASLTPNSIQSLPPEILNCILGISAVHMAASDPSNCASERTALEAKVTMFEGCNHLFQEPQRQRVDLLLCCMSLVFAMDVSTHLLMLRLALCIRRAGSWRRLELTSKSV
jgi:hypothetical protein